MPMIKFKKNIQENTLLIEMLDSQSLEAVNSVFNTTYSRKKVKSAVRVERAEKPFSFWDRLMKQRTGVRL